MSFLYVDLDTKKVSITEDGMLLPQVRTLYDIDTSKDKSKFKRALTYIFFVYNPDGVFSNKLPEDRKRITCNTYLEGVSPEKYEENKHVQEVIGIYKELSYTPARQLYERIKFDIQEVQKALSEIPYFREVKVKLETEVEVEVKVEGQIKKVMVPVNETVTVKTDNSDAKAKAIKNTDMLFKQEEELRKRVDKETLEMKIRTRRKFDEIPQH